MIITLFKNCNLKLRPISPRHRFLPTIIEGFVSEFIGYLIQFSLFRYALWLTCFQRLLHYLALHFFFIMSVPHEGYSRNASCIWNQIATLSIVICKHIIYIYNAGSLQQQSTSSCSQNLSQPVALFSGMKIVFLKYQIKCQENPIIQDFAPFYPRQRP